MQVVRYANCVCSVACSGSPAGGCSGAAVPGSTWAACPGASGGAAGTPRGGWAPRWRRPRGCSSGRRRAPGPGPPTAGGPLAATPPGPTWPAGAGGPDPAGDGPQRQPRGQRIDRRVCAAAAGRQARESDAFARARPIRPLEAPAATAMRPLTQTPNSLCSDLPASAPEGPRRGAAREHGWCEEAALAQPGIRAHQRRLGHGQSGTTMPRDTQDVEMGSDSHVRGLGSARSPPGDPRGGHLPPRTRPRTLDRSREGRPRCGQVAPRQDASRAVVKSGRPRESAGGLAGSPVGARAIGIGARRGAGAHPALADVEVSGARSSLQSAPRLGCQARWPVSLDFS